jgi:hypothetical protein
MDNKTIQKWHLAGFLIALMVLLSSCRISGDLKEISADISTYSLIYKSERGLGNDRFDIYAFSLKKAEDMGDFLKVSEESAKFFWDFLVMIDLEAINDPSRASSLKAVKADIDHIRNQEDGQYLYVISDGSSKLYVYSPTLNSGYCLLLVI